MKAQMKFKKLLVGLVAASALALSANAQAVTIDAGIFGSTLGQLGTATNPFVVNVNPTGAVNSFILDTVLFDLGTNQYFNMTSTSHNILALAAPIFENAGDTEVVGASPTFVSVFLPNLGLDRDYHLHPQGLISGTGSSYQLTMWGAPAPVPVPAAVWLFGSGLVGLVGLARRKMRAAA